MAGKELVLESEDFVFEAEQLDWAELSEIIYMIDEAWSFTSEHSIANAYTGEKTLSVVIVEDTENDIVYYQSGRYSDYSITRVVKAADSAWLCTFRGDQSELNRKFIPWLKTIVIQED